MTDLPAPLEYGDQSATSDDDSQIPSADAAALHNFKSAPGA